VFVLLDSLYELVTSLFAERGAVGALLGVLGIVIGILLIRHPVHGVLAVGLLVGPRMSTSRARSSGAADRKRMVAWILIALVAIWLVAFIVSNSETVRAPSSSATLRCRSSG
jgi:hypothetical protein